jgi:acetylglutamate kinase
MVNAKAKLLDDVYTILDKEQRKIFTREFTAAMVEKTIKKNMIKGYMLPKKGQGGSCR